nr:MAG TPA: hypothetical protein [Caudoviricetes sp.]
MKCTPIRWRNTSIGKQWMGVRYTSATRLNTSMPT